MYSTKTATSTNEEFSSNYMPVGINDNVTLDSVSIEKSPTGLDFIRFVFKNEAGQTAEMTEWKNKKNIFIKTDEDLQKRDNAQFGRILQIMNCFGPIPDVSFSNFVEMINWVHSVLNPMLAAKIKLRLKVIYDKNGYTKVSNNGIFVEPMSTSQSQIKLFKRDTLERPIQADNEDSVSSSGVNTTSNTATEDLPF